MPRLYIVPGTVFLNKPSVLFKEGLHRPAMPIKTQHVLLFFCVLKATLHLIADGHSGFQGDELLHIETGNHLAFGYMEFPPVIGWLASIQNLVPSHSVFLHHFFPHLASLLILLFMTKITVELGGGTKAVFLVLLSVLIAPAFGRSQQLFQPVVFSQLFWVLNFYQLLRYVKYGQGKYLWYLSLTLALAFLSKYDAVFFIFGLLALLCFKNTRRDLIRHRCWWHILVFLLLIAPNLYWQYQHDFPVLDMFSRLYETQLNTLTFPRVLQNLIVSVNPVNLLLILPGIGFMFHTEMRAYRPLCLSIAFSAGLLAFMQGKAYYFYPIILTLLPIGGIFWAHILRFKRKGLFYPLAVVLFSGVCLIPFGMPLFPLKSYIKRGYPYEKREVKGGKYGIHFEERYSEEKWEQTMLALKATCDSLQQKGHKDIMIWGKHYAQAGAVALFRDIYQLPPVFSLHGSFYNWLPQGDLPEITIALRYSGPEGKRYFEPYFKTVKPVTALFNPYADEPERLWQTVFICEQPKVDFTRLQVLFAQRVFE